MNCFALPRHFIQHIPSPIYHGALERQNWHNIFTSECWSFLGLGFGAFCLPVRFVFGLLLQRPSNLITLCYFKQMKNNCQKTKARSDLQASMHCCGSNPGSMLNCSFHKQHLSHAIITLTEAKSIYLGCKICSPKQSLQTVGSRSSGSRVLCITEPHKASTSICG